MKAGRWVIVCGPSGAGKDSVIDWVRASLEDEWRIVFARRMVTRAAGPGSDHDEISRAEFARLRGGNRLAWHWEAHGNGYGVSLAYAAMVAQGRVVVVNGSREHAASIADLPSVRVALVTAPAPLIARRLQTRGRDSAAQIEERLARNDTLGDIRADLTVTNDGGIESAAARLRSWLLALAYQPG